MKIKVKLPTGKFIEEVSPKDSLTIGRSTKSDICIPDESLSRSHCLLQYSNGDFFITDLGSANGVHIDGRRIGANLRTQFTTFQELLIGHLEVTVSDEDLADTYRPGLQKVPSPTQDSTTHARKINKELLSNPKFTKRTPQKKSGKNIWLTLFAILILVGAFIYHSKEQEELKSLPTGIQKNIPEEFKTVMDQALSSEGYKEKGAFKTCTSFEEVCMELQLSVAKGEGIYKEGEEYFVFMRPDLHIEDPKLALLKEKVDQGDVATLYLLLKSSMFGKFSIKEISQIHLILMNSKSEPSQVYRFHTKNFVRNGPEKARLLSEIEMALATGNTIPFWTEAKPLIQSTPL